MVMVGRIIRIAAILLFLSSTAIAESVTVGECTACSGYLDDSCIYEGEPIRNYGVQTPTYWGSLPAPPKTFMLFRGDLSDIPNGSTIASASLSLYVQTANGAAHNTHTLYQIADANNDWVEGTEAGAPESGSPCYNDHTYQNIQEWAGSAGLNTAGTDYVDTLLGSLFIDSTGWKTIPLNDDGCDAIESRLADDDIELLGRYTTTTENHYIIFKSGENADSDYRPYLTITYSEGNISQVINANVY